MKKILCIILINSVICLVSSGQVTHSLNIGPDLGLGANFGRTSKASFGGSLEYLAKFTNTVGVRFATGFNQFNAKGTGFISFWPARVGIEVFVFEDLFFVYGEGGIAWFASGSGTRNTGPSFAVGAGYRENLTNRQFLQFSTLFNYFKLPIASPEEDLDYTWLNFRVAYGFSWGKKSRKIEEN